MNYAPNYFTTFETLTNGGGKILDHDILLSIFQVSIYVLLEHDPSTTKTNQPTSEHLLIKKHQL